ncbi:hypothetical protein ACQJBY_016147 [Aegilops geniculata]
MGGVVDKEINTRKGPYVFRLHGQNYHHIGTLLPEGTDKPRFAQLYIYNTENEVANRISASRCNDNKSTVDPNIVKELQIMLDDNNILAKTFRMARDRFQEGDYHDYTLRILGKRNGTHNLPSASEVAALVVRDPTGESQGRDIVVEYKNMVPQRISEIHPKFMSMQYPLLFPYGEDGFKLEIPYKKTKGAKNSRKYVTLLDYYAFYLQQRPDQGMLLLKSGHLSLQFWVDVYTCIEQNRLNWIRHNQGKLRTELYSGLQDAIKRGDTRTEQVGKRIIVPSSFTVTYTIEFQRRGLPHAHILIFLKDKDKYPEPSQIDKIISAEIPNKDEDPEAFGAVENFMMHGPCGEAKQNSPCMVGHRCSKHFPKRYNVSTTIDEDGFPVYKRKDDGRQIKKGVVMLDNRFVVPYNRNLLVKFQAHINVEWCNRSRSIKYLYKYIDKDDYQVTTLLKERLVANETDEIKKYLEMRYISTSEACWRIFQFDLHYRDPAVERLPFHLENEQQVIFPDSTDLDKIVKREGSKSTKFTQWMEANKIYELGKELTYAEFPTKFVWKRETKCWQKRKRDYAIGRIYYAHPASGERHYLRMLLNTKKGCTSFEDIRTIDGVTHPTYKSACQALGFLDDGTEWIDCINEASSRASGAQLRQLFTTILSHCEVTNPKILWDSTWEALCEDMQYKRGIILNIPTLQLTNAQKQAYGLIEIEKLMRQVGKSLKEYTEIELPNAAELDELGNRLINEEVNYDMEKLKDEHKTILNNLNQDQKKAFDKIMESVNKGLGKQIFVEGYSGTGKTYLWKALTTKLRSEGKIVLAVASCGIAALLLQGGRTAHSRFRIPLNITEESTCEIKQGSHLAELLKKTSLILWDEAPMANKHCFEALDKSLRDILRFTNENSSEKPFGGMTIILGGDFRQILPVITKGRREQIVNATIKRSYLWKHFEIFELTENMRLKCLSDDPIQEQKVAEFAEWILQIGDGKTASDEGEDWIKIPKNLLLQKGENRKELIVESIYPNLLQKYRERDYLEERAILCPRNDTVKEINDHIMSQIQGDEESQTMS